MINLKRIFRENVTYVEYSRSGVEYYTENLENAVELVNNGWKHHKTSKGFKLSPPEVSIVDLTDYNRALQYGNLYFNYIYYIFLYKLIRNKKLKNYIDEIIIQQNLKYKKFEYLISIGPVLDSEIRIAGSDKRIELLKMDMVEKFLYSKEYRELKYTYKDYYKELEHKNVKFDERTDVEKKFLLDLKSNISLLRDKRVYNPEIFKIYNIDKIKMNNIDIILFLPFGCFKYLSSFINKENLKKIMFWEIHADSEKESTFKLYEKNLKEKNVLIIDNIYSGKTLNIAKKKVIELGGNPILLSLNPKNISNINMSDYVMILNTIYKKEELDLTTENLFEELYVKTLKE